MADSRLSSKYLVPFAVDKPFFPTLSPPAESLFAAAFVRKETPPTHSSSTQYTVCIPIEPVAFAVAVAAAVTDFWNIASRAGLSRDPMLFLGSADTPQVLRSSHISDTGGNSQQLGMENIDKWVVTARTLLNEAKAIGISANAVLKKLKISMDANNLLILKINYLISFLQNQIKLMTSIFRQLLEFNKKFQVKFVQNVNFLRTNIGRLNEKLTELNNIIVHDSIRKFVSKDRETAISLYDYLSLDEFLKIQQNYEIFQEHHTAIGNYLVDNQLKFFEINLINFENFFQNLLNQFNNTNYYFYTDLIELNLYSNDNTNTELSSNEKYSILVNYYEQEMANLIQSLTHHYDQCNEAKVLQREGKYEQLQLLLPILSSDSLEAPSVLQDLRMLCMKIEQLHSHGNLTSLGTNLNKIYKDLIVNNFIVNDFLQKTNKDLDIEKTANRFNNLDFNFLKPQLVQVSNFEVSNQLDLNLARNIEKVSVFLEFLTHFEKSYFKLILEIDRSQKVNAKVKKLISSFMSKLNALEMENAQESHKVAKELGKFLPSELSEIVAPRIADTEKSKTMPLIEVVSQFGEYPELDQSLVEAARKKV